MTGEPLRVGRLVEYDATRMERSPATDSSHAAASRAWDRASPCETTTIVQPSYIGHAPVNLSGMTHCGAVRPFAALLAFLYCRY